VSVFVSTVALLGEADPSACAATCDVLVAVEDHLRAEGRVPGHLDRQVPSLPVHDVEAVVIHLGAFPGQAADYRAVRGPAHIPRHRRGPGDQDHEHSRPDRPQFRIRPRRRDLPFRWQRPGLR